MPIVGEQALLWRQDAYSGNNLSTLEFNMPASRAFVKVCLSGSRSPDTGHIAAVHITKIKRKRQDGSIEEININSNAVYDDNMTSVFYYLHGYHADFYASVIIQYWG